MKILFLILSFFFINQVIAQTPPGGVASGLQVWYDASDINGDFDLTNNPADGTLITTWVDKSGNGNDTSVISGKNPGEMASSAAELVNGSSFVKFNKTGRRTGSMYDTGVDIRSGSMEDMTLFIVYRPKTIVAGTAVANRQAPWGVDNGGWDRFYYSSFNRVAATGNSGENGIVSLGTANTLPYQAIPNSGLVDELYLLTVAYNGDVTGTTNSGPVNGSAVYFNGDLQTNFTDTSHPTNAITTLALGWDGDDGAYDGEIGELLVYNRILDDCEIALINQDIGLKYGKDFSGFTGSYDDTTVYFENANAIGIGVSSCTGNTQIDEAFSGNLTFNNPSSNDTVNEFLIVGHNNSAEDEVSTDVPTSITARLSRVWAVEEETNTNINGPTIDLGTVNLIFDVSALGISDVGIDDFVLLVDQNRGALNDANIAATGGSYASGKVTFTGVNLAHADLFTLAFIDTSSPTVTINQDVSQEDPEYYDKTAIFNVVFNEAINPTTFTCADIVNSGTATADTCSILALDNTTFQITYTTSTFGTIVLDIPSNNVADFGGNLNTVSTSTDNKVTIGRRMVVTNRRATYRVQKK